MTQSRSAPWRSAVIAPPKLDPDDLMDIRHLGFRGEALALHRLHRTADDLLASQASEAHAWEIAVEGGRERALKPAALSIGTRIDVEDLFFATPARLKFLKSRPRREYAAISEVVKRLALMANPKRPLHADRR